MRCVDCNAVDAVWPAAGDDLVTLILCEDCFDTRAGRLHHHGIVDVVMPAGSVVVFLGTLWHRGGANASSGCRLAITPQYCEPWARLRSLRESHCRG